MNHNPFDPTRVRLDNPTSASENSMAPEIEADVEQLLGDFDPEVVSEVLAALYDIALPRAETSLPESRKPPRSLAFWREIVPLNQLDMSTQDIELCGVAFQEPYLAAAADGHQVLSFKLGVTQRLTIELHPNGTGIVTNSIHSVPRIAIAFATQSEHLLVPVGVVGQLSAAALVLAKDTTTRIWYDRSVEGASSIFAAVFVEQLSSR